MIRKLLLLNGLAVLMLPIHHATGYGFDAMFVWTDRYLPVEVPNYDQVGSLAFYAIVVVQQLDYFALPAFMFTSGFFAAFAAGGSAARLKWSVVKSRVWQLLVPFAVWTMIFFLLFGRRLPNNLDDILDRYYYLPLLMQFYLMAPFLLPLAKKRPRLLLLGAAGLELGRFTLYFFERLGYSAGSADFLLVLTPRWLFPMLFFWFAFGAVANYHRDALGAWLSRRNTKWALLAATVGLALLAVLEYQVIARFTGQQWLGPYFGGYFRQAYALGFILTFLAFEGIALPFSGPISQLGSKSLGVYLAHARGMYIAAVLLYREVPWILGNQLLYQLVLIVVSLAGSLLLMDLIKRSPARPVYRYLFG